MRRSLGWMVMLGMLAPATAAGQTTWDAPSFLRPGSPRGLTVALTNNDPGGHVGVLALWRDEPAPIGVGFRGGLVDAPGDQVVGLLGLDVSGNLPPLSGPGNPRALWWTGAGVGLGDHVSASFPLGLVFGWTGTDENFAFMPYAGAHAVLTAVSGPGDNLDLDGVVDLGIDLRFAPAWTVRFAGSFGGRESLGIGLAIH